eukprot:scaffold116994_cov69-Phaeocystis_antarctica.AAC.8
MYRGVDHVEGEATLWRAKSAQSVTREAEFTRDHPRLAGLALHTIWRALAEVAARVARQRPEVRLAHREGQRPPLRLAQQRHVLVTEADLVAALFSKVKRRREAFGTEGQGRVEVHRHDTLKVPLSDRLHPLLERAVAHAAVEDDLDDGQQRRLASSAVPLEAGHLGVAPGEGLPATPAELEGEVETAQGTQANVRLHGARYEEVEK